MKKSWSTQNFVICTLTRTGHDVNVPVHRLVAKAFVPNPHNLKNVGFLDGDHWNVRADNLQWCNQWQIKGGRIYYDENGVEMPWVREKYDD